MKSFKIGIVCKGFNQEKWESGKFSTHGKSDKYTRILCLENVMGRGEVRTVVICGISLIDIGFDDVKWPQLS